MAAYQTGTVRVTAGGNKIFGAGTQWLTYVTVGDLFQRTTENAFYQVAAVNSATQITLTSRYTTTELQSGVATNVASVNTATKMYSGNVGSFTPVIQNSFVLVASPNGGGERFTDNGAGVLTGENTPAGSGTIDYDSGAWTLTLGTDLTATLNLAASFTRGNYVEGAGYQIVTDFTPNYQIPEMSTNDVNFAHIFTRAVRKIDQSIRAASGADIAASKIAASWLNVQVNATIARMYTNNASITNASLQNLTVLTSVSLPAFTNLGAVNATFTNATIANATILGANIARAKITNATITNASITNASIQVLRAGIARLPQANLTNATIANASITNASIQTLQVLNTMDRIAVTNALLTNASANNASIGTLKVSNAIAKLKVTNGSITEATIGKLLVNASRLRTNGAYDGYALNATMSATVEFGETLYLDSNWNYSKANSATSGTLPVTAMAVSAGTGRQNYILKGQVCNTAWNWSATALIYAAATDGALTQKVPTGAGIFTQIVGHPLSPDTMMFDPNLVMTKGA